MLRGRDALGGIVENDVLWITDTRTRRKNTQFYIAEGR